MTPGASDRRVLDLEGAALAFGGRTLWSGLDLAVDAGEFVAVLGPNGSGKTSLLRVLLGQQPLAAGSARILGRATRAGDPAIGYIPQQRQVDPGTPVRARDLVALGLDGHRWGLPLRGREDRARVAEALDAVGAAPFARARMGRLSGGEQQRVRVGQAIVGRPRLLLCDEPLLALDLAHQRIVADLIDRERTERDAAVLFVTHDVNPILPFVDRVLYLVDGRFRVGRPEEVLTGPVLSELYGTDVRVLRVKGQIIVVGADEHAHPHDEVDALAEDEELAPGGPVA